MHEVGEQHNPKTRATVNQLLDRYLETLDVEPTMRTRYEDIIRLYLRRPSAGCLGASSTATCSTGSSGSCIGAGSAATAAHGT